MSTAVPVHHPTPRTLSEAAAALYIGVAPGTLRNWRSRGQGPPYLRVGRRRLYAVADLDRWLEAAREDFGRAPASTR